jgi:glycosyltransferase involved in cell wall biosynthesis
LPTPRVLYWNTACLEPQVEAVSKELFQLAAHFPKSRLFAVSPHARFRFERGGRVVVVHPAFDPLLRVAIPLAERLGNISHVYGEVSPWIFHRTLRRNPLVLTVASEKGRMVPAFLERCRTIVAQTRGFARRLVESGVPERKVRWIPPGVDLARFRPRAREAADDAPGGAPRILFASAPRTAEEMGPRGVHVLVAAARANPGLRFRLLYRAWARGYTSLEPTRRAVRDLPNVELTNGAVGDMARVYPAYDFAVIPYTDPGGGKECPNSLLEGLACGVPALVSARAPFAEYVAECGCGVVFEPTPEGLAEAVSTGMAKLPALRANARAAAERDFDLRSVLTSYEQIYEECLP